MPEGIDRVVEYLCIAQCRLTRVMWSSMANLRIGDFSDDHLRMFLSLVLRLVCPCWFVVRTS